MKCLYALRFMRREGDRIEGSTRALSVATGLARSSVMIARRELETAGVITIVDAARGMLVIQSNGSGPKSEPLSPNSGLISEPPEKSIRCSVNVPAQTTKDQVARKSSLDRLSLYSSTIQTQGGVSNKKKGEGSTASRPPTTVPTPIDKMLLHNALHHSFRALGVYATSDKTIWISADKQARNRLREGAQYNELMEVAKWAANELKNKKSFKRLRHLPYLWGTEFDTFLANAKDSIQSVPADFEQRQRDMREAMEARMKEQTL